MKNSVKAIIIATFCLSAMLRWPWSGVEFFAREGRPPSRPASLGPPTLGRGGPAVAVQKEASPMSRFDALDLALALVTALRPTLAVPVMSGLPQGVARFERCSIVKSTVANISERRMASPRAASAFSRPL